MQGADGIAEGRGHREVPQPLLWSVPAASGDAYVCGDALTVVRNQFQGKMEEEKEDSSKPSESEEGRDVPTARRFWALENLYNLFTSNSSLDLLVLERFLLTVFCVTFEEKNTDEQLNPQFLKADFVDDLKVFCRPSLSDAVRDRAQALFFSVLQKLSQKTEENRPAGVTKDNELYGYVVLQEYQSLEKRVSESEDVSLLHTWEESEKEARKNLLDQIEVLRAKIKKENRKQDVTFVKLLINLAIEQPFKPDYSQFIPDLLECYRQFTLTDQRDDERPIAVLLEIVLIMLRTSSKTLRNNAVQLFGSVCDDLCEEDVKDMLNVFWTNESMEEEEEEEASGEEEEIVLSESEEEDEEKNEEDEEKSEEKSEEVNKQKSEDEHQNNSEKQENDDSDVDGSKEVVLV